MCDIVFIFICQHDTILIEILVIIFCNNNTDINDRDRPGPPIIRNIGFRA